MVAVVVGESASRLARLGSERGLAPGIFRERAALPARSRTYAATRWQSGDLRGPRSPDPVYRTCSRGTHSLESVLPERPAHRSNYAARYVFVL